MGLRGVGDVACSLGSWRFGASGDGLGRKKGRALSGHVVAGEGE